MPTTDHRDATLHYRLDGDSAKPPLVLLNSLGSGVHLWDPVMPLLAPHFHVLRTDKRGHGRSTGTPGDYSIAMLADDVVAVMDAAGIRRAAVAGVSIGGMIGMHLAANAPERVERLVVSNSSAFVGDRLRARIAEVRDKGLDALADGVIRNWFAAETLRGGGPYMAAVRECFVSGDPNGYTGCCAAISDMDLRPVLSRIGCPTLVIAGTADASLPPEHSRAIAAAIPGATLVELPAAHIPFGDMPERYAQVVREFLQS